MIDALKHHQRLCRIGEIAELRIGARQVGAQDGPRRGVRVKNKRDRVGDKAARAVADQEPERMGADQRMEGGGVVLAVQRRFVHGPLLRRDALPIAAFDIVGDELCELLGDVGPRSVTVLTPSTNTGAAALRPFPATRCRYWRACSRRDH